MHLKILQYKLNHQSFYYVNCSSVANKILSLPVTEIYSREYNDGISSKYKLSFIRALVRQFKSVK